MHFDQDELQDPVDGNELIELTLSRIGLGNIDMEIAERVALELAPDRLLGTGIAQAGDTVALQAAMQ